MYLKCNYREFKQHQLHNLYFMVLWILTWWMHMSFLTSKPVPASSLDSWFGKSLVCQKSCSLVSSCGWLWSFHVVFPVPRIVCQNTVLIHNIVREWKVKPSQISSLFMLSVRQLNISVGLFVCFFLSDTVDLLHLSWIGCYSPSTFYDQQNWGSRDHHYSLPFLLGSVPCLVLSQLDLALLFWGIFWPHSCCCWRGPDRSLLWLLLFVCYKR